LKENVERESLDDESRERRRQEKALESRNPKSVCSMK
jgi:hypothetical protein